VPGVAKSVTTQPIVECLSCFPKRCSMEIRFLTLFGARIQSELGNAENFQILILDTLHPSLSFVLKQSQVKYLLGSIKGFSQKTLKLFHETHKNSTSFSVSFVQIPTSTQRPRPISEIN
jgi:hypothetical protein